jgi:hypothetical protein
MTSKKNFIRQFFFLTIALASCTHEKLRDKSIIKEGIGVDDFEIKTLLVDKVKSRLGHNYELIKYGHYSAAMYYRDQGIYFYYKMAEPEQIFAISCDRNFKGKTKMGFDLQQMKVSDMRRIYGKPRWGLMKGVLNSYYDSSGIYFGIESKLEPPSEITTYYTDDSIALRRIDRFYDSLYRNDNVIEISIGIPGTAF